ncbi:non-homologous end-joining DNA ligase [Pseudalkalibacillus salsuginis]|uniref:non-homologous end-joining DNA ligase n=1 Tax=Pseudalkalibacillus salsuginis TaxID=2910972 RepID=UPI001F2DEFCB|nr:non-homologous end-joining DNA ligase [Pseudalkalibacillus salsuginis]MCF6409247.1 non-homologous end-joining DNA ligase [Pseudalkalibacillus salsuginis]
MRYKPMLPTLSSRLPEGEDWYYEIKYDGFRSLLHIDQTGVDFYSRNLKSLDANFPEIINEAERIRENAKDSLPLLLDGELCILESDYKASFSAIQQRGRLKSIAKILQQQAKIPATLLIFDLVIHNGKSLVDDPYIRRKKQLEEWMDRHRFPQVCRESANRIQWIPFTSDGHSLFQQVKNHHGEGVVAKRDRSLWLQGKRTKDWLKVKSLFRGFFIIVGFDEKNGYAHVAVRDGTELLPTGVVSHGLEGKEREALIQIVKNNQIKKTGSLIEIAPRICVELAFLEIHEHQLRQPRFIRFRLDIHWEDCTWRALQKQMGN